MPAPTHDPQRTADYGLADTVAEALERYRDALAHAPPGTPPPDETPFAEGLSGPERERFHLAAEGVRSAASHAATLTLAPPADPHRTTDRGTGSSDDGEPPTAAGPPLADKLADYELLGELGSGGMGVVYKARQRSLNRLVALKMVLAGGHATPGQLARFKAEALAVAKLDHPNIVRVYDIGEHDGLPYFAMEFVDGPALDKKLNRRPMEPPAAARLLEAVARAMHYAHQRGVIHRDLKPGNVMLAADGTPKVADFGLAKLADEADGQTRTGVVMGTPNYMAPEQAEGNAKHVTHLADVYALGATLYELVTGRPPFQGSTAVAVIAQVRSHDPVSPTQLTPGLPKDVETICLKCLAKEPHKRYPTAEALADDLRRFQEGLPIVARPISSVEKLVRWCRRKPREATLTLTAAGLLAALFVGAIVAAVVFRVQKDEIAAKSTELEKTNTELVAANEAKTRETRAFQRQSTLNADLARYLVRTLAAELKVLGLSKQRERLVQYVLGNLGRLERLSEENAGIADRSRISALVQIGELFQELATADPERRDEFLPKAEEYYQKAHDVAAAVAADRPDSDLARANLALTLSRLGAVAVDRRRLDDADHRFIEAQRLRQEVADRPQSPAGTRDHVFPADALNSLAEAHLMFAKLALLRGDARREADHRARVLELRQRAYEMAKADPTTTEEPTGLAPFQQGLAEAYLHRAAADAAAGKLGDAQKALLAAVALREQAVAENAESLPYKKELAVALFKIGAAKLGAGKAAEAADYFDRMAALMDQVVKQGDEATSRDNRWLHSLALYGVAVASHQTGNPARGAAALRECVRAREELYREDDRPRHAWGLMVALARGGNADRAVKVLKEEEARGRAPQDFWFNAACTYSLCAAAVGGGKPDDQLTAEERKKRDGFVAAGLAAVDKVAESKSRRLPDLRDDPDLEYLRKLPAYQTKVAALLPPKK